MLVLPYESMAITASTSPPGSAEQVSHSVRHGWNVLNYWILTQKYSFAQIILQNIDYIFCFGSSFTT